jgi:hypothetical protein
MNCTANDLCKAYLWYPATSSYFASPFQEKFYKNATKTNIFCLFWFELSNSEYRGMVTFLVNSWSIFLKIFDGWQSTEICQIKPKYAQIWWKLNVISWVISKKWGPHQKFANNIKIEEVWQLFDFVWEMRSQLKQKLERPDHVTGNWKLKFWLGARNEPNRQLLTQAFWFVTLKTPQNTLYCFQIQEFWYFKPESLRIEYRNGRGVVV